MSVTTPESFDTVNTVMPQHANLPPVRTPPSSEKTAADIIRPITVVETPAKIVAKSGVLPETVASIATPATPPSDAQIPVAAPLPAEATSSVSATSENEALDLDDASSCTKCFQRMDANASVCESCGYYATLGTFVDLQKDDQNEPTPLPWKMLYIPAAMLFVVVESLVSIFVTHPESPDRTLWSVLHLVFGALIFAIPHMRAQFKTAKADADTSMVDFLMRPVHIWRRDFREYPKSLPWMVSAAVGLTAVFCSLVVIRGLPSPFLDKPIPQKRKNLTLLVQEARRSSADSMEEALNDVADVRVVNAAARSEDDDKKRAYVDCVIVGYNVAPESPNRVSSLVIATEVEGRLVVVGNLTEDIPEDIRVKLASEFNKIRTALPITTSRHKANWVKPKYYCRTWHHEADDEDGGKSKKGVRHPFHFDRMLLLK